MTEHRSDDDLSPGVVGEDQPTSPAEAAEFVTEPESVPAAEDTDLFADDGEAATPDAHAEAQARIAELEDQLARANAATYNVNQEYSNYVRRSKADGEAQKQAGISGVLETLLTVLDDIELARQHGDLEGSAGAIAIKLEHVLETNYKLTRYGAEGDEFDPQLHEALMHSTSADVESEQVAQLIQPGYRVGEAVLRPARVGVVSPE